MMAKKLSEYNDLDLVIERLVNFIWTDGDEMSDEEIEAELKGRGIDTTAAFEKVKKALINKGMSMNPDDQIIENCTQAEADLAMAKTDEKYMLSQPEQAIEPECETCGGMTFNPLTLTNCPDCQQKAERRTVKEFADAHGLTKDSYIEELQAKLDAAEKDRKNQADNTTNTLLKLEAGKIEDFVNPVYSLCVVAISQAEQIEKLREALEIFGRHDKNCNIRLSEYQAKERGIKAECSCGLNQALGKEAQ